MILEFGSLKVAKEDEGVALYVEGRFEQGDEVFGVNDYILNPTKTESQISCYPINGKRATQKVSPNGVTRIWGNLGGDVLGVNCGGVLGRGVFEELWKIGEERWRRIGDFIDSL